jgi:D-glycero-D-manno-heptose 1,7-bisphosphate phosphatase
VFLDRDGTIVEDVGYVTVPEMLRVLPGVAEAIVLIRRRGWKVIVVSNQAGVAKGLITEDELAGINMRLVLMLGAEGAEVDGIYCCPHHPEGTAPEYAVECDCRKPRPGLLEQAAREHDLELSECVMVGDALRDIQAGRAAGTAAVLVLTGHGPESAAQEHGADYVARDLVDAAGWIASREGNAPSK